MCFIIRLSSEIKDIGGGVKNFLYIVTFLFALLLGCLLILPYFYNLNGYKSEFSSLLSEKLSVDTVIEGNIEMSIIPSVSIKLHDVSIANTEQAQNPRLLFIQNIKVELSWMQLLLGKIKPKHISLSSPSLSYETFFDGSNNLEKVFDFDKLLKRSQKIGDTHSLEVENGFLTVITPKSSMTVDYISGVISHNDDGEFSAEGSFKKNGRNIQFNGEVNQPSSEVKNNVSFTMSSDDAFEAEFLANYNAKENVLTDGKLNGKVTSLSDFLNIFSETRFSVTSKETAEFSVDVKADSKQFTFENVSFVSENVKANAQAKGVMLGSGENRKLNWECDINFSLINVDNLTKEEKNTQKNYYDAYIYYTKPAFYNPLSQFDFEINPNLSALFTLTAEKMIYKERDITDVQIDLDIFNRKLIINKFYARLPGDSSIDVIGDIVHNGVRPKFKGSIKVSGNKLRHIATWLQPGLSFIPEDKLDQFIFTTMVDMTPQNSLFKNIEFSSDNTLIKGSLDADLSGELPKIDVDLLLSKMNLDDYHFTDHSYGFFHKLFETADKSSYESFWYNNIRYKASLKINAEDLVFNGHKIKEISTSSYLSPGVLRVVSYSLESEKSAIKGDLHLNLKATRPTIKFSLLAPQLDTSLFLVNDNKDNDDKDKIKQPFSWSKDELSFLGLRHFQGNLKVNIKSLLYKNEKLANVTMEGKLEKQVLTLEKAEVFMDKDAKVKISGSLGVGANSSSAFNYNFFKVPLNKLLSMLEVDVPLTSGYLFLGGKVSTNGKSLYDWATNASITSQYTLYNLILDGFDLKAIITKSPFLSSAIDMEKLVKESTKGGKTLLNLVKGELNSKKRIVSVGKTTIKTPYTTGVYAGNIDLLTFNNKSVVYFAIKPRSVEKPIKILYNLSGKLTHPEIISNYTQLENYITSKSNNN